MKKLSWKLIPLCTFILGVLIFSLTIPVFADDYYAVNQQIKISSNQGSVTVSGTTVNFSVTSGKWAPTTSDIKIYNNTDSLAKISFKYEASSSKTTFVLDGATVTKGTYTATLGAGDYITLSLKASNGVGNAKTATLALTDLSIELASSSSTVTVTYDDDLGSVTVGGTNVNAEGKVSITPAGATLAANANENVTFLGWIDCSTYEILSKEASFNLKPMKNMTVQPVFVTSSSTAWFMVDNAYLCNDLNVATTKGSLIVLAADGTLSEGTYTIPSSDTLLIPFDDANTRCTTESAMHATVERLLGVVDSYTSNAYVQPTPYRKLTMASDAHIIINGALSLSGKQSSIQGSNGMPVDKTSYIDMEEGSKITVNNKGFLYAWGYITGEGSVEVNNGGTVYECFIMTDWRGGTAASNMIGNDYDVFPISQYYVQNVEVPMKLHYGATEYAYVSLIAGFSKDFPLVGNVHYGMFMSATVPFVGSNAMFRIAQGGYLIKDYIEETDSLRMDVCGDLSISSLVVSLSSYNLDSASYVLPLTNNLDVHVQSGTTTITQDMAILPGASVTIHENANVVLGDGVKLYVYDYNQWEGLGFVFSNRDVSPLKHVSNGTPSTRVDLDDAKIIVEGTLDASKGYIYTTESGATISGVEGGSIIVGTPGTQTTTYQYVQSSDTYAGISITPAKLQHGDGTYTAATVKNTYIYDDGFWRCASNHDYKTTTTDATCTDPGWTGKVCTICGFSETGTTIPAKGHTPGEEVVENEVPATNSAAGSYDKVTYCTVCGEESSRETVEIPALCDHDMVGATCTTPATCSKCGEIGSALGHSYTNYVSNNDAACEQDGTKTATCDHGCGEEDTQTDEGSALSHSYTTYTSNNDATCKKDGTETASCDNGCGNTKTVTATGTKLSHTHADAVSENRVESTCTVAGSYDSVVYCSVCDEEISRTKVNLELAAHTAGEAVEENRTESTCTAAGSYESVVYCSVCNEEQSRETVALGLADHTEGNAVEENRTESTCTVAGSYESVVYCSVCNEEQSRETVALGLAAHTEGEAVQENKVNSTCTVAGSYDEVVDCAVCGVELSREKKTLALADHTAGTAVEEGRVESTCTVAGSYNSVVYCSVCKTHKISSTKVDLPLAEHTAGAAVEENRTESTCTVAGSYESVVYCSACNAELNRETVTLALAQHTEGEAVTENNVPPTCTAAGSYDTVVYCTECGTELSRVTTTVKENGHTAGTAVKENEVAVTCTTDGSYDSVVYCTVCSVEISREAKTVTASGHTHSDAVIENKVDATCLADGSYDTVVYCSKCDAEISRVTTTVTATGHTAGEAVVENSTAASCDAPGSYESVVYCSVCDAELSRDTVTTDQAVGHNHKLTETITAATCTDVGKGKYTCERCGDTEERELTALGHKLTQVGAKAPTCEDDGYKAYEYCSACTYTTYEKVEATGHDYDAVVTAPTCTADGFTTYTCHCGDSYISDAEPAKGHTNAAAVEENVVEATCKAAGSYDSVVYCSVCNAELSRTPITINKLDHTPAEAVKENEKASTCTVAGSYESVVYCSVCDEEISRDTVTLELAQHTESAAVEEGRVDSTCKVAGYYYSVVYCSVCNAELSKTKVDLSLAEHTAGEAVQENKVNSTCTVAGSYDEVVDCAVCGVELSREKKTLALADHTAGTAVEEGRVESTCTVAGSYNSVVYCSVCKTHKISSTKVDLPLAEHTAGAAVEENRTESTCTVAGSYESVVYCSACNAELNRETVTLALAQHTAGEAIEENRVASTCKVAGSYDSVVYCSVCNAELSRTTVTLELAAHTEGAVVQENKVASTCIVAGSYDDVVYCTVCNAELSRVKVTLEALGHSFTNYVDDDNATCTGNRTKTAKCDHCDETDTVEIENSALDHSFTNYVSDGNATCTADGTKTAKCDRCDETDTIADEGSALDHSFTNYVGDGNATCTQDGTKTSKCDRCDETDTITDEGSMQEHPYESVVTAPTCTAGGYTTKTCPACGVKKIVDDTNALGHDFDEDDDGVDDGDVTEATCTEGQYTTYTCQRCTHSEKRYDEQYPALDHDKATHEAKAPTCTEVGWDAYEACSRCDYSTKVEKAALGHSYTSVVTEPTCTTEGYTTYTCSCGDSYVTDNKPIIAHVDEDDNNVCDDCGATMCDNHTWTVASPVWSEDFTKCTVTRTCVNGHTETAVAKVTFVKVPATCTEDGGSAYVAEFSVDWAEEQVEGETVIPATGHAMTLVDAKDPTCTANGNVEHYYCSNCKVCFEDEAGEVEIANVVIGATGHSYESVVTAPTCIARGYTTKTCSVCGDSYKTNYVSAFGHARVTDAAVAPTCTETGLSEGKHCSVCQAIIVAQNIIPSTGHKYDNDDDVDCNVCGADRRLDCEHEFTVLDWDATHRWNKCSKCPAIDETSKETRKYTITFQGFEGGQDITLPGTYEYNSVITVPMMKSYYFEFDGAWTVDGQVLAPQSKLSLGALNSLIDEDGEYSEIIYVKGDYKIVGLKPDAVLMKTRYGDYSGSENDDIFMTISLYINVEAGMMPVVTRGDIECEGTPIGSLGVYFYQIPLTYEDILNDNLAVIVSYVDSTFSKEVTISIKKYMQALSAMFENQDDIAGTKMLMDATKEYAQAAQNYFDYKKYEKEGVFPDGFIESLGLPQTAPPFNYNSELLKEQYFWDATMNGDKAIAEFSGASVTMGKTYELIYRFNVNLPEGAKLKDAYIILTDNENDLSDRPQWDGTVGTGYQYEIAEENGKTYYQVSIKNVPASEMAVRYATVYLEYEYENGSSEFAYSRTLKYGVTTYLDRQLYALQYGDKYSEQYQTDRELWLVAIMFDELRDLAGLADPLDAGGSTDAPDVGGSDPSEAIG